MNKKARVIRGSSSGMQLGMPTPTSTPKGLVNSPCRLAAPTNRAVQAGAGHCWATGHSAVKVGRSWLEANRSGKSATPGPADQEQYHHSPQGGQIMVEANRWWKSANHSASDTKERHRTMCECAVWAIPHQGSHRGARPWCGTGETALTVPSTHLHAPFTNNYSPFHG